MGASEDFFYRGVEVGDVRFDDFGGGGRGTGGGSYGGVGGLRGGGEVGPQSLSEGVLDLLVVGEEFEGPTERCRGCVVASD